MNVEQTGTTVLGAPTTAGQVVIWSSQLRAWWRPYARGYTDDLAQAGVWTRSEAERITAHCRPEKRIRLEGFCP